MAWARLDDRWHDHPKVIQVGLEAAGLWAMCLTWACHARRSSPTPGVVPAGVIARFAGPKARRLTKVLVDARMFDAETPDGWPIHDFDDYLPKYDVEQAKAAGAKGGKAKHSAKQTASEPLGETLADTKPTSSTRASAPRNPVPVPLPTTSGAGAPTGPGPIVAAWVEAMTANGVTPTGGMRGQVGKLAKELLAAGNDPARVLDAARSAGEKGYATIDRELGALSGRARPLRAVESERLPAIWRGVE